jgi:hypothetical protein
MSNGKKLTLMAACRDFFGLKPGQTAMEFGKEYKLLNDTDRAQITPTPGIVAAPVLVLA